MRTALLTTREAAELLGVGKSTVKRWADQGLLRSVRTAGGHRRFDRTDVERFGVTVGSARYRRAGEGFEPEEWLGLLGSDGDLHAVAGALLAERGRLGAWWRVAEALGACLEEVGRRWAEGRLGVLEEHRISARLERALTLCCQLVFVPRGAPRLLLVAAEGDEHTLGLNLVELCAREAGWSARGAGRASPVDEVRRVIAEGGVGLVALSASLHSSDPARLRCQYEAVAGAARKARVEVVLGGRGAWPERPAYGHRLYDFEAFHDLLERLRRGR